MGSNTIIAIVVGAILVIVGFSLRPVLNGASNSLYSYFRRSCDDGNGNRFLQAYWGDDSERPGDDPAAYYTKFNQHGGKGMRITEATSETNISVVSTYPDEHGDTDTLRGSALPSAGRCAFASDSIRAPATTPNDTAVGYQVYNEQGELLDYVELSGYALRAGESLVINYDGEYNWVKVAPMLERFAGINNLLLTILPVVSIAGFLGISGAKLYSYGKGTASIGSSISTSIFTLVGIVIAMVIAGPIMGAAVDANQVVVSGQYQVNGTFGNIIQLLFAMIPVVYIAGLVTLVGLQARTALVGSQGGGGGLS